MLSPSIIFFRGALQFSETFLKLHTPHYPYLLPNDWEWCKLEELVFVRTGATPSTTNKAYYNNGKIAWVNSSATSMLFISSASNFITDIAITETNCYLPSWNANYCHGW